MYAAMPNFVHMNTAAITMKNHNFTLTFDTFSHQEKHLLFSIPQTHHYQEIKNLTITQKPDNILKIEENQVAVFKLDKTDDDIDLSFSSIPKPISMTIDKHYTMENYQRPTVKKNRFINGEDPKIKAMTEKIIGHEKNVASIIALLYQFTLDYLTYGKPTEGLYSYHQALNERETDCGGFSTFLASLLQSLKIPSRLVVGFFIDYLLMHAWLEVLLPDGNWFPMDPSIEWKRKKGLTKRQSGFGYIPADRLVTSFGCDYVTKIENKTYHIDLLQNPVYI